MTLQVWAAQIAPEELPQYLRQWEAKIRERQAETWLMIEWWNRPGTFAAFADGLQELAEAPADTEQGSAFGALCELRWRRVEDRLWLVVAGELDLSGLVGPDAEPPLAWKQETAESIGWDGKSSDRQELLLWGTDYQGNNDWAELRIPRLLHYPVTPEKKPRLKREHARLQVTTYPDAVGRTVLWRRSGLQAFLPDEEE